MSKSQQAEARKPRIRLRPIDLSDASDYFEIRRQPEVTQWR